MLDREIKVAPKMEKRLIYLGFEEKNLNIENLLPYQIQKRYFVHPSGIQIRVNVREKNITVLSKYGVPIDTKPMFLSSYLNFIIKENIFA